MNGSFLFFLISAFQSPWADPSLTPERALQLLPERAVTFSFVWERALDGSDSFDAVRAEMAKANAPELFSRSEIDPQLGADLRVIQDRAESSQVGNPFAPQDSRFFSGEISAATKIQTGTSVSVGLDQTKQRIRFDANPTQDTYVLKLSARVSQSLLRDSFGSATRGRLESGKETSKALHANILNQAEIWTLDLVELFHRAWISQRQYHSAEENVQRRARLLKAVNARFKRGTSVAPDLYQVESAKLRADVELRRREQELRETWRALVVILKLPEVFSKIEPSKVPMKLDSSAVVAQKICEAQSLDSIETANSQLTAARHQKNAMISAERAARSAKLWDLSAYGALTSGTVDPGFSGVWSDAFNNEGPGWALGLKLSVPLFNFLARAEWMTAKANAQKASAHFESALSLIKVRWLNECEDLNLKLKNLAGLKEAFEKQTKREKLEADRFSIGNTSAFAMVQAGDDVSFSELNYLQSEAELRARAWSVMALSGSLQQTLLGALKR